MATVMARMRAAKAFQGSFYDILMTSRPIPRRWRAGRFVGESAKTRTDKFCSSCPLRRELSRNRLPKFRRKTRVNHFSYPLAILIVKFCG
jgi:hypothetical protein